MTGKPQDVLSFSRPNNGINSSTLTLALHDAAKQLAQPKLARPRLKTKDIVGYLLGHGARAWRASFPITNVRVRVMMPNGNFAVKIRFK